MRQKTKRQTRIPVEGNFSLPFVVPRWLTALAGAAGSILGLATNLYSSAFRSAIAFSDKNVLSVLLPPILVAIVTSGSTLLIYRWLIHHREDRARIVTSEMPIGSDALDSVNDERDLVVGRKLRYLEAERQSDDLLIFLHGLGLDANDFRPYMAESRFHCIALTLYGFNSDEKNDDHYKPISLQSHVQLLIYALNKIREEHRNKRITLVGFSFGADIIFFMRQFSAKAARELNIRKAILLDPNVNEATTTISSRVAVVDKDQPTELVKVLDSAGNVTEFRNLCEYLYKITSKDFAQIQRHAKEVLALCEGVSYEKFLDRMGQLSSITEGIHVVLSFDYEQHFNAIARGAVARGMDPRSLECSRCGHFELIGTSFLKETLEGVLATGAEELNLSV
jgi:pimeloyl-ACP methyl ester carboxylesterase